MQTQKNNRLVNVSVLILAMLVCGILSGLPGKELTWDLAGYHFYNPFAYLNNRIHIDYWPPSAIQTFITPTLDFLNYFLIKNFTPQMAEFLIGAVHGINFALLFYIAHFFTRLFITFARHQIYVAIVIAFMGMYAPTVGPFIGSFSNDNTVSIFVLAYVLGCLHNLQKIAENKAATALEIVITSMMLGIAVGAKLTMATYVVGAFIASALLPISFHHKLKLIGWSGIGVLLGFVLADGYWMWMLWQQFHNPFFPFLNGIFHSPFFQGGNWLEPRYMPTSMLEALFFPFYFAQEKATAEFYFSDFRFVIVYSLLIIAGLISIFKKQNPIFKSSYVLWFYFFFIFSYIIWEIYFSIMRYLGVLQMLSGLFIFLLVLQITQDLVRRIVILFSIFSFIYITMVWSSPERLPFGHDYFNVKLPSFVQQFKDATVIIPYAYFAKHGQPRPNHYLIPFFPANWHFTGVPFYQFKYELPDKVREFVKQGPKQVFLLASIEYMPSMQRIAASLALQANGKCGVITSDRQRFVGDKLLLCPFTKQ